MGLLKFSGLFRCFSSMATIDSISKSTLFSLLKAKIDLSGPITVADYMKEVLTNTQGYYMSKDVFGREGDFITSPEVSQLFGEMMGVWSVNEVRRLGKIPNIQIVELGPGRGTMTLDILRVWSRLKLINDGQNPIVSLHLVEVSPTLSSIQADKICSSFEDHSLDSSYYKSGRSKINNLPVFWYRSIMDVPREGFNLLFANEFFDALPIHMFKRANVKERWQEVLIDTDPLSNNASLRFILSRGSTPASLMFTKDCLGKESEVCPEAWKIMEYISHWLEEKGGIAIVCDYGDNAPNKETFRGFRRHKVVSPLSDPGSADLTADVDFSALKRCVGDRLVALGPVTQASFLEAMHASTRLEILKKNSKSALEQANLQSSYEYLTDPDKMGDRFKLMAFFPAVLKEFLIKYPPVGFPGHS